MLITIFTATYKGANLLTKLFESLMRQTNKDFEWILVNDGSPDNTDEIVEKMQAKANFPLHYFKKENGGKTTAVNLGIQKAIGDLWLSVDHDDFLSEDAVEVINQNYPKIKDNKEICSITFLRHHHNGTPIGTQKNPDNLVSDFCSYRTVHKITGDRAEVVKTDNYREFCPIPTFSDENNCLDGYIWLMLAKKYKTLFIANEKPLYFCEYLQTGRSSVGTYSTPRGNMVENNLYASMYPVPVLQKLRAYNRYWQAFFVAKNYKFGTAFNMLLHKWGIIVLPVGFLVFCYKKLLKRTA
ncbi:MAG: glycosyltransferase [Candidatus Symbiothrix sp.]|jgi:glycosyltransferase involved in cell wall biosynthesis|nr:glycosyltransferase [Candidatus Symbiothrix sp.]